MKRQTESGMGPKCQLAVLGSKPRRRASEPSVRAEDPRQPDLFDATT
jgi:hypothetical protein